MVTLFNLVAAQSVSALSAKVPSTQPGEALDCLLQNIGTAIVFSSSDPLTDQLWRGRAAETGRAHISSVVRSDLCAGQAFVVGRNLSRHNKATVNARAQAGAVAGAPHMSRYFTGMPDPVHPLVFSNCHDFFVNPYRKAEAAPPVAGSVAMGRSFRRHRDQVLLALESAQGAQHVCDELLMEDARCRIALRGRLIGERATICQPGLNLVISHQSSGEWRCSLSLALVLPQVLEFCLVIEKHQSWKAVSDSPVITADPGGAAFRVMKIVVPDDDDRSTSRSQVEISDDEVAFRLPYDYWRTVCPSLARLEREYREVSLKAYFEKEDPFDVFVDYLEGD